MLWIVQISYRDAPDYGNQPLPALFLLHTEHGSQPPPHHPPLCLSIFKENSTLRTATLFKTQQLRGTILFACVFYENGWPVRLRLVQKWGPCKDFARDSH